MRCSWGTLREGAEFSPRPARFSHSGVWFLTDFLYPVCLLQQAVLCPLLQQGGRVGFSLLFRSALKRGFPESPRMKARLKPAPEQAGGAGNTPPEGGCKERPAEAGGNVCFGRWTPDQIGPIVRAQWSRNPSVGADLCVRPSEKSDPPRLDENPENGGYKEESSRRDAGTRRSFIVM
jgi:hypothetical protein